MCKCSHFLSFCTLFFVFFVFAFLTLVAHVPNLKIHALLYASVCAASPLLIAVLTF